ncbi:MAG: adenylate/guanylate cyclase domain-containing protein [Candidatus Woesearchaeota archaeon]
MKSSDKIKRLAAKIRSQNTRSYILSELVTIETNTKEFYQLLKEILLLTVKTIGVELGFIILYNKDNMNPFEYGATNTSEQLEDQALVRDICDNLVKTGKQIIVNDTRMHKRMRRCRIQNVMALPLMYGSEPIGVFMIMNKSRRLFKKKDLILFRMICKFTAVAVEHAKSRRELSEKDKELSTIYAIDRIRDTIKDFDTMMEAILQEITDVIDAKLAFFMINNRKMNTTELKTAGKLKSSTFVHNNSNALYDTARTTLNKGELTEFKNVNKDIDSAICTPFMLNDDTMGVFGVINSSSSDGFTKIDKNLLNAIAKQADSAVFEDLAKTEIKTAFQSYVSPEVMKQILANPEENYLRTEKREMSVLFSDLRDFTAWSEQLAPEHTIEILNEHFETMLQIIHQNNGTLDKFVGDEIMAIFGAPVRTEAHALKAVKTAVEMQAAQKILSKKFKKKYGIDINIGIGINTGEMIVGNVGARQRMDYTVIGNSVNVAARLCGAAKADEILITATTHAEVKKLVKCEELEPIRVKGKSNPIQVYNVKGMVRQ